MRPCIVGIGGAGGNLVKQFLVPQDVDLHLHAFGVHLAFGGVKGIWLDSDQEDASDQKFFGRLLDGWYPGYVVSHDLIDPNSETRDYVMRTYGHDLKVQGYDRRAEYLKAVFEIFEKDPEARSKARDEFQGEPNPIPVYIWRKGFRQFTSIAAGLNGESSSSRAVENEGGEGGSGLERAISFISSLKAGGEVNGRRFEGKLCDSILFTTSLGGGTGTGFVNPLSGYVRSEEKAFPIFVLGALTERGKDTRHAKEGKRNLAAVIAMYDLLTRPLGEGIDALILVDNQVLYEKFGGNYEAMDKRVFQAFKPLLDPRNYPDSINQDDAPAFRGVVLEGMSLPPVLVPCYHRRSGTGSSEAELVRCALTRGMLTLCDPRRADRALVFTRGFMSEGAVIRAVNEATGISEKNVKVYRKVGNVRSQEILILLRNPYGRVPYSEDPNTLEFRLHEVVDSALHFLERESEMGPGEVNVVNQPDYRPRTRDLLQAYFYGKDGLKEHLAEALGKLERGEFPVFVHPINIFDGGEVAGVVAGPETDGGEQVFTPAQKAEIERIARGVAGR